MIERCTNPKMPNFERYGARGIEVCEKWRKSFIAFFSDVGERPSAKHSIDRIDNAKGYVPGNVRWATITQQARNKSSTRLFTIDGRTQCLKDWWRERGRISYPSLRKRLSKGIDIERALGARL